MVNAFGYYASAKGMVLVPNLSGLTSSAAIALLESSGLDYLLGEDVATTNSALDNLVAEQSPLSNTLVDYDTVVSFRLNNFVAVQPPFFPSFPDFPSPPPSLPTPTFQLNSTGNSGDGNRFVNVFLTNIDTYDALGGVTFSPIWTSFESTYPEYIVDAPPNTDVTITVTVSKSGYSNATGSITVNSGAYTGPAPTPDPTPTPTPVITVWYGAACCSTSGRITASSASSSSAVIDALDAACPTGVISQESVNQGTSAVENYPATSCTTSPTPTPVAPVTVYFGYCDPYNEEQCEISGISGNVTDVNATCNQNKSTFFDTTASAYNWWCGTTNTGTTCTNCYGPA